jgi:hypothetical protein
MSVAGRAAPRLAVIAAAVVGLVVERSAAWDAVLIVALIGLGAPLLTPAWWHRVRTGHEPPPHGLLHDAPSGDWRVILQAPGESPVRVIKIVRELTGLDLLSAKTLVEAAPREVGDGVDEASAQRGADLLAAAGATAVADRIDPP